MSTMRNTAGLEGLVASPYRWNAGTYSSFFRDAYDNVIKVEVERLQNIHVEKRNQAELVNQNETGKHYQNLTSVNQNCDLETAKLVHSLVVESDQVLGNENWTDIIGPQYWDILKLDEFGNDRYKLDKENNESAALKKKSVVQLLKFIRDKISHIRTYKDEMREKLLPFFDKDENQQYQFNDHKFVVFWISKFPKFVPYLWLKLCKFRDKLVNYYPDYEIEVERLQNFLMDINNLEMEIKTGLFADMENGNVLKRFKGPSCSLEFRGFPNLVKILDKNDFITVLLNSKDNVLFSVFHASTNEKNLEYVGASTTAEKVVVIFADNITNDKIWKYCRNCECRVIVFCDPDKLKDEKIEEVVGKFKIENNLTKELFESPIKANELSVEKQNWVFENGQVCIQSRDMKIKDIFQDKSEMLEEIRGDILNKLLKQGKPIICANYKYPEFKGVYLRRRLYFTDQNGKEKATSLKVELKKRDVLFETEIVLQLSAKTKMFKHFCNKCGKEPVSSIRKIGVFGESECLLRVYWKNIKAVYFLAESGMGKSKQLLSLGKMMKSSLVIYCPFRHFVDLLKKRVETRDCSKMDIKSVILGILECNNKYERSLIDKWLERKCDKGTQIELQLDGLDEIPSGNLGLVLKALKIIQNDFPVIRLWITSTKPLPKPEDINFTYCSILPFSFREKISFYKQACRANHNANLTEQKIKQYSFAFSLKLLVHKDLANFLDSPLNYSMLVELHEENMSNFTLIDGKGVGIQLFESLYHKKFNIMYREKKGMAIFDEEDFKMECELYLQLYTHLALVHLFPKVSSEFPQPLGMRFFTIENYHKMGIITNFEPLTFIHLKYADFLVAKYIMKVLKTGEMEGLCPKKLFNDLICFTYYDTPKKGDPPGRPSLWKFVDEYLGKVEDWTDLKWLKTHKRKRVPTNRRVRLCLTRAFECNMWNLARVLINLWIKERDRIVCNWVLHMALIYGCPVEWFKTMCEKLSQDNKYELLMYSVQNGQYEIARYLIERKCGAYVFDRIAQMRNNGSGGAGGGILHCIVDRITQRQSLTILVQVYNEKFVENTIDFIRFVIGKNRSEIKRKDKSGRSVLLALPLIQESRKIGLGLELVFALKECLINELNADVNERSNNGESVLCLEKDLSWQHCPVESSNDVTQLASCVYPHCKVKHDLKNVQVYHKTLALVTSKNFAHINLKSKVGGLTPLQEAVYYFGSNLGKESLVLFQDAGVNFNELDKKGDTILHHCVKHSDDIEFIKGLVECGSEIDVQNKERLCALCLAEKEGKVEINYFFCKRMEFMEQQNCKLNCINEMNRTVEEVTNLISQLCL